MEKLIVGGIYKFDGEPEKYRVSKIIFGFAGLEMIDKNIELPDSCVVMLDDNSLTPSPLESKQLKLEI